MLDDVLGQFGRVLFAELECARGSLREDVAIKTMKCTYMSSCCGKVKSTCTWWAKFNQSVYLLKAERPRYDTIRYDIRV